MILYTAAFSCTQGRGCFAGASGGSHRAKSGSHPGPVASSPWGDPNSVSRKHMNIHPAIRRSASSPRRFVARRSLFPRVTCCACTSAPGHGGDGEQPAAAAGPAGLEGAAHQRAAPLGHAVAGHGGDRSFHVGRQPAQDGHRAGDHRQHP